MDDLVTIAEAAEILGLHRNTVRNKVKAGKLVSIKVDTENGPTYMIPKAALNGDTVTVTLPTSPSPESIVEEVTAAVATIDQEERAKRLLHETLAPFIEQVAKTSEELGRLKAENAHLRQSLADMSARSQNAPTRTWWDKLTGRTGV